MKYFRTDKIVFALLCSFLLAGCSNGAKPSAVKTDKPSNAPLIEIVHSAVMFYADGGTTFKAPAGTSIEKREVKGVNSAGTLEITGMQQKGSTVAGITFSIPAVWIAGEKQKLSGLAVEMKELTACAQRLVEKERSGSTEKTDKDSCRMEEITANNLQGISILSDKVPHIRMTTLALR
ncbi:MAG: hypothetical protein ACOYL3_13085 [Desulfuromonadaceae bacterium]